MTPSRHVNVRVDLARIRANAESIRAQTGVPLIAVVKANAYGLGARQVVRALRDVADEYCVFSLREAAKIDLWKRTDKRSIVIGPPFDAMDVEGYREQHARPAVTTVEAARRLADVDPVICVDTGMQRFACAPDRMDDVIRAGSIREAYTHATSLEQLWRFREIVGSRALRLHAAGSSLLHEPAARLDGVRPGLALYRDAARVTARLVEARASRGPIGYSGWHSETGRHGVIIAGYSNGLRTGPCAVNGQRRRIAEVGMQSAFVEIGPDDQAGDEVVMLGDELSVDDVRSAWGSGGQEVLSRLCAMGRRHYAL